MLVSYDTVTCIGTDSQNVAYRKFHVFMKCVVYKFHNRHTVCVPYRCDDDEECCELDDGEAKCCEDLGVVGYVHP